jgi:hypothetical protein
MNCVEIIDYSAFNKAVFIKVLKKTVMKANKLKYKTGHF